MPSTELPNELVTTLSVKEYEHLRKEHADTIAESRTLERQALLASAAIWTWVLTQPSAQLPHLAIAKALPFVLCIFGGIRSFALFIRLDRIGNYTRRLETSLNAIEYLGWETDLAKRHWLLTGTSAFYWLAAILTNAVIWAVVK